ncbi:MAG: hypothetical protein ILP19_08960 [Oscillospiraceae bacterium]|nr:hypothetical protein [Oscillospiraceae bacterium]
MNKIEIQTIPVSKGYEEDCFIIDGIPLHEWIKAAYNEAMASELLPDDLAITWDAAFDNDGDARFMRALLDMERLNIPILSCPDDLDFTCTVIVADIEKTESCVRWKRIGRISGQADRKAEKEHGILFVDAYTEDDWKKYRDLVFMTVDSSEWLEWISENWSEELYRRRMNYTYPFYQDNDNIQWIYECDWCFDRNEYDKLVSSCRPRWWMDRS